MINWYYFSWSSHLNYSISSSHLFISLESLSVLEQYDRLMQVIQIQCVFWLTWIYLYVSSHLISSHLVLSCPVSIFKISINSSAEFSCYHASLQIPHPTWPHVTSPHSNTIQPSPQRAIEHNRVPYHYFLTIHHIPYTIPYDAVPYHSMLHNLTLLYITDTLYCFEMTDLKRNRHFLRPSPFLSSSFQHVDAVFCITRKENTLEACYHKCWARGTSSDLWVHVCVFGWIGWGRIKKYESAWWYSEGRREEVIEGEEWVEEKRDRESKVEEAKKGRYEGSGGGRRETREKRWENTKWRWE